MLKYFKTMTWRKLSEILVCILLVLVIIETIMIMFGVKHL